MPPYTTIKNNSDVVVFEKTTHMPILTTREAFEHFLENTYPDIKPKTKSLRMAKLRFDKKGKLSEEKMSDILFEYGYQVEDFEERKIGKTWDVK